jgi:NAD(P)-dependent dehydrogenase (short-subunit alcohol dehydrogenase family)
MRSLDGRVIVIAGAAGALGPTLARTLAAAGAALELGGRNEERLRALAADTGAGTHAVDLGELGSARAWADAIASRHSRIDGLLHIVGGWRGGTPVEEQPPEDWDWLESLLVRTVQNSTRAFAKHLLESKGRFAIVSTGLAQAPTSGNASYATAKAAAEAWTLALADRFRGTGATANIVVVGGALITPEMRAEKPDESFAGSTPVEAVAEALAYLCSEASAPMNGQRLVLRGAS